MGNQGHGEDPEDPQMVIQHEKGQTSGNRPTTHLGRRRYRSSNAQQPEQLRGGAQSPFLPHTSPGVDSEARAITKRKRRLESGIAAPKSRLLGPPWRTNVAAAGSHTFYRVIASSAALSSLFVDHLSTPPSRISDSRLRSADAGARRAGPESPPSRGRSTPGPSPACAASRETP